MNARKLMLLAAVAMSLSAGVAPAICAQGSKAAFSTVCASACDSLQCATTSISVSIPLTIRMAA